MAIARQRIHLPPGSWPLALTSWLRRDLWEGEDTVRFEQDFAEFIGVPAAVAVPSGRAGLRFIFDALNLEPGSEIICSAFGYPVVPHLARSLGYRVRFVDCELETLGMDPGALAATISERTGAVIATHLYGVPCRVREIAELAQAHGAILIEDCAHCYGAAVDGRKVGSFGTFAYFSFETSKPINTLGGGMVTTTDGTAAGRLREAARAEPRKTLKWLAKRLLKTSFEAAVTHPLVFNLAVYPALRLLSRSDDTQERFASGYQQDEVTLQGRMGHYTNYQAKLGRRQMRGIQSLMERRVAHAERLARPLAGSVRFQTCAGPEVRANYMLVTALFPRMKEMASRLLRLGVDTKHHYMRDCSGLVDEQGRFPHAAQAEAEVLHLPAYPELSEAAVDRVAARVKEAVSMLKSQGRTETPAATSTPHST